jgi:hypothetical protein
MMTSNFIASEQLGEPSLNVVRVDERVGVRFELFATFIVALIRPAILAFAVSPRVLDAVKANVPLLVVEAFTDGVLAVGGLGAVDRPPREQRGDLGDC